jgi:hypothetical protein
MAAVTVVVAVTSVAEVAVVTIAATAAAVVALIAAHPAVHKVVAATVIWTTKFRSKVCEFK